jgi:hypothetical protein
MAGAMMRESRRSIMSKALWVVQVVLAGIFGLHPVFRTSGKGGADTGQ